MDIGLFKSARHFAAWLGLVPRQHSTGGKTRLGRITKAGNEESRTLLVLGAPSMVRRAGQWNSAAGAWVRGVLARRPARLATVALANKMARIAWALMTRKEDYRPHGRAAAAAVAAACGTRSHECTRKPGPGLADPAGGAVPRDGKAVIEAVQAMPSCPLRRERVPEIGT